MTRPDLVVHADWGSAPAKRWMATARLTERGTYHVQAPEPVGPLDDFLARLAARAPGSRLLVGFDFPIGLPRAYARRAGIDDFCAALLRFGQDGWAEFYRLAERPDEIGLLRPFYPKRPGGTKRHHLVDGLGVDGFSDLLRRCDRATPERGAAGALFWTMGAQQPGRAAIIGWRDVVAPALRAHPGLVRLWPFDGDLGTLLQDPGIVFAEAYPAEAALHLGLAPPGRGWSKRRQVDRAAQAPPVEAWAERRGVLLSGPLLTRLRDGFGAGAAGEDAFDAALGLFGMLEVVLGHRPAGVPEDTAVREVEGWILGLAPTP